MRKLEYFTRILQEDEPVNIECEYIKLKYFYRLPSSWDNVQKYMNRDGNNQGVNYRNEYETIEEFLLDETGILQDIAQEITMVFNECAKDIRKVIAKIGKPYDPFGDIGHLERAIDLFI